MRKHFKRTKTAAKRPYKKRVIRAKKPAKAITRYVKQEIKKMEPHKMYAWSDNFPILGNDVTTQQFKSVHDISLGYFDTGSLSANSATVGTYDVPVFQQGVGMGNRAGSKIRVLNATLRGFVSYYQTESGTQNLPIYLKMFVGRLKNDITKPPLNMVGFQKLGNIYPPTVNLLEDLQRLIEKNYFNIYAVRNFKLGQAQQNNSSGAFVSGYDSNSGGEFKLLRKFSINLTKHCKSLKFETQTPNNNAGESTALYSSGIGTNNTTDTEPQNQRFYVWFQAAYNDGETAIPDNQQIAILSYDICYTFEDA